MPSARPWPRIRGHPLPCCARCAAAWTWSTTANSPTPRRSTRSRPRATACSSAPAIGLIHNTLYEAEAWGIGPAVARDLGMERCLENAQRTYAQMRQRGIRAVIGGDYGFAWTPQGTNARDIEHFVRLFGYSASEALQCATRVGGELMGLQVGQLKPGWLADVLIVDGDPLKDVTLLQDKARLRLIMKDGVAFKERARRPAAVAACRARLAVGLRC